MRIEKPDGGFEEGKFIFYGRIRYLTKRSVILANVSCDLVGIEVSEEFTDLF